MFTQKHLKQLSCIFWISFCCKNLNSWCATFKKINSKQIGHLIKHGMEYKRSLNEVSKFEVKQEAVSSIWVLIRRLSVVLLNFPLKMALHILIEWVFLKSILFNFEFLFVWSSFGHPRVIRLYICLDYWTSD